MDAGETVTKKPVLHYAFTKEKNGRHDQKKRQVQEYRQPRSVKTLVQHWFTSGALLVHSWCAPGAFLVHSWCIPGALLRFPERELPRFRKEDSILRTETFGSPFRQLANPKGNCTASERKPRSSAQKSLDHSSPTSKTCSLRSPGFSLKRELCPPTRELCPTTREVCPPTPELCPPTRELCPPTRGLCPLTPELCPLTRELCSLTRELCLRHESCVLRHESCVLRHEGCALRHQSCVFQHESCVLDTRAVSSDTGVMSSDTRAVSSDTRAVPSFSRAVSSDMRDVSTDTRPCLPTRELSSRSRGNRKHDRRFHDLYQELGKTYQNHDLHQGNLHDMHNQDVGYIEKGLHHQKY